MTENRSVASWNRQGEREGVAMSGKEDLQRSIKRLLAVMNIIARVILVMILQVRCMSKIIKLYTLNMCGLLCHIYFIQLYVSLILLYCMSILFYSLSARAGS